MQHIIYIGNNKKYIEQFSQLSGENTFHSASECLQAIPVIDKAEKSGNVILFYERKEKVTDIAGIQEIRKKYPLLYIVLITDFSLGGDAQDYLKAGINNTIRSFPAQQEIDDLLSFNEKRKKEHSHQDDSLHTVTIFKLPRWKRTFDVVFSCVALILFSPILLLTVLAIRMESKGPVLYKTKRVGSNYRIFDFLRFRSTYTHNNIFREFEVDELNADEMENQTLLVSDELVVSDDDYDESIRQSTNIDENIDVTRVGRFIRKYSIDDLPQFINILRGEMSVVGNRPLPLHEAELLTNDNDIDRFMAPAGLTGLWQVEKRGDSAKVSPQERKSLDVKYAKTFNFGLDIKILARTVTAFVQKGYWV